MKSAMKWAGLAVVVVCLGLMLAVSVVNDSGGLASLVLIAQVTPALFGLRKLDDQTYPVAGALASHAQGTRTFDIKKAAPSDVITEMYLRINGTITKVGAAAGTATGRENPEALVVQIDTEHSGDFVAEPGKQSLTARASLVQGVFDRAPKGFSIRTADVGDAAGGTTTVDFMIPLKYAQARAKRAIEFALPMFAFNEYRIRVQCGGRERLFTGGTPPTWDLSALRMQIWARVENNVAVPAFHYVEEIERQIIVTSSTRDLMEDFAAGYLYTSMLLLSERDDVVVNDIINDIELKSGSRVWFQGGQLNAPIIQRDNLELSLPTETMTGIYYLPIQPGGMNSRAVDALRDKLQLRLDVTVGAGTSRIITARVRRIKPNFFRQVRAA